MSELDDRLRQEHARVDVDQRLDEIRRDHGKGWIAARPAEELVDLVNDFTRRLSPTSGQSAYWVERAGVPSVHVPGRRVGIFADIAKETKAYWKNRLRQETAYKRGGARLLVLGDAWSSSNPVFVNFGDGWTAATELDGGSMRGLRFGWASDGADDFTRRRISDQMVQFLAHGTYHEQYG
ncbi:hypothetical protein ACDF64_04995 [Agromyces sp. MMS24-JH15]|uniref:hypothetical protein n=1 Tax=Agromyces sp. MMS24-JH15 TaxID=3243765 RepID=UPI00374A92A4